MRSYIRLDPRLPDRKESYSDGGIAAYVLTLCLAEQQPDRGRFKRPLLKALLGKRAKWIGYLIDNGDLVELPDGRLYVDGWDEWQEGNMDVQTRMATIRSRRHGDPESPGAKRTRRWRESSQQTSQREGGERHNEESQVTPSEEAVGGRRQAVGTKPQARGGDGAVTAGADEVRSKNPSWEVTPEAAAIARAYVEITDRELAERDWVAAADFDVQLVQRTATMTVPQIRDRMASHWAWCEQNSKPKPRWLGGFWGSLRHEADHISDTKPPTRRTNGGMSSIDSVLGGA